MAHTDCRGDAKFNFELSQEKGRVGCELPSGKRHFTSPAGSKRIWRDSSQDRYPPKLAEKYNFLKRGDELTCDFINKLPTEEEQENLSSN